MTDVPFLCYWVTIRLSSLIVRLCERQWACLSSLLGYVWDNELYFLYCWVVHEVTILFFFHFLAMHGIMVLFLSSLAGYKQGNGLFFYIIVRLVARQQVFGFHVIVKLLVGQQVSFFPHCRAISRLTSLLCLPYYQAVSKTTGLLCLLYYRAVSRIMGLLCFYLIVGLLTRQQAFYFLPCYLAIYGATGFLCKNNFLINLFFSS